MASPGTPRPSAHTRRSDQLLRRHGDTAGSDTDRSCTWLDHGIWGSGEATNIIPPDRARTANLDYLALGDWHGHLPVNDRTAYSGTPETDRFGRDEPGSVIVAEISAMAPPRIDRVETGRFRWLSREWQVAGLADFSRAAEALHSEVDLSRTLLDLSLIGAVSLADRVAIHAALADDLSHALRWLGYDTDTLIVRPTADDLANIDIQGTLAKAAERLQLQVAAGGADAALANAALERLYIEALRLRDEQPA